jgi:hypothetical protein
MTDRIECSDYHCRCDAFVAETPMGLFAPEVEWVVEEYCSTCSCHMEVHGQGHRAEEEASVEQARAAVEAVFTGRISPN